MGPEASPRRAVGEGSVFETNFVPFLNRLGSRSLRRRCGRHPLVDKAASEGQRRQRRSRTGRGVKDTEMLRKAATEKRTNETVLSILTPRGRGKLRGRVLHGVVSWVPGRLSQWGHEWIQSYGRGEAAQTPYRPGKRGPVYCRRGTWWERGPVSPVSPKETRTFSVFSLFREGGGPGVRPTRG